MSRRQLFTVTFLLVFLLLLWELGLILRPFFSPILWAVILATTTYPVYIRLLARVGHHRNVAAGIMTGGVLIMAVVPAVYGMILAGQQGVEAYAQASEWLKGGHLKDWALVLAKVPGVGELSSQELMGRLIVSRQRAESRTPSWKAGKPSVPFFFRKGSILPGMRCSSRQTFSLCSSRCSSCSATGLIRGTQSYGRFPLRRSTRRRYSYVSIRP